MKGEDEPWQFSMFVYADVYADEYDGATAASDRLAVKLAARPQGELELISYYRP